MPISWPSRNAPSVKLSRVKRVGMPAVASSSGAERKKWPCS